MSNTHKNAKRGSDCHERLVRLLSFVGEACAWTTGTLLTIAFLWIAGYSFVQQWPSSGLSMALGPVIWGIGYGLYRSIKWARKIRETNVKAIHAKDESNQPTTSQNELTP